MKTYQTNQIRNVVLLGNSSSGKTIMAESMLLEGGIIQRKGEVENKNTVSDYNPIELEMGNSVFSSILYTEYNDYKINILDAPGADDFVGGAVSSLKVADTALMLINAQNGPEVGTEIHARHIKNNNLPLVLIVNQLDHEKANFDKTIEQLKERFGAGVVLAQYPVNAGPGFDSIVDVITMKMYKYPSGGGKPQVVDIPDSEKSKAEELQAELIEKAAENEEALMEIFFEKETLSEEEMNRGIKTGLLKRGMFPIFCTSSKTGVGVSRLLEFLTTAAPSPGEMEPYKTTDGKELKVSSSGPATLFIFKTSVEAHVGEIIFFKVISGELSEGMDITNTSTANKERLSQLLAVAGKTRNKVSKMYAGDIGATVKLKGSGTNETLSNDDIQINPIEFPEPKFRTAIRSLSEGDEEKLGEALNRMHDEDPTIQIEYSKELKQIIVSGQGEHHLNILKWHLDNVFKIGTEFIPPRIPYRETITKISQADYRHKKQSGGAGQFGEVHLVIEPYEEGLPDPNQYKVKGKELKISVRDKEEHVLPWGGKLVYYNCIVGGSIDNRFMPAILKGIMEKMENGPLTGSYARDIRVAVYDGKMHPVDSNEISFKLAGRNAFSMAFKEAGPKIMEPIYLVEVIVPSDRMGDVMSDLQTRRAIVQGMSSEGGYEKITAKVPLADMNKYSTALSSITNGRAMYSMKFSEYAPVPADLQEKLLQEHAAAVEEE
ncbi:MAG: elongation factor G [Bacteroidota bacterium]